MAFTKAKALQEAQKLVAQGKIAQAIRQYEDIFQKESSDLNLLNTIGDLYVREKNISKALENFLKLAEAYVQEGFTVKAIAMHKKVSKLDPNSVEPLLKLAELYQLQGLGREAREQYAQAFDYYRKRNEDGKALEILRTVVRLDPENTTFRLHLAEFCEKAGRQADAAETYLEVAEHALRRKDMAAVEPALKNAERLEANQLRLHLLEARVALGKQQHGTAEKLLASHAELRTMPEGRRLLLEAYLGGHKLEEAQNLLNEVYRANPQDFSPLASFTALCIEKGDYEAALKPLAAAADELIEHKYTGPLMECLRRLWEKRPQDVPLLELIYHVCERSADEFTLPEVLEALGHAYVQAGDLEKAEGAYRRLSEREPANEHFRGLLKQILKKLGKEAVTSVSTDLSDVEMAPAEAETAKPTVPSVDAEEAALVKEVLENSDLYSRYGLIEKAVTELEKGLASYPNQIELHKRILEVSQRNMPARAAQAAQALARIYTEQGDSAKAKKYEALAHEAGVAASAQESVKPHAGAAIEVQPVAPAASQPSAPEIDLSSDLAFLGETPTTTPVPTAPPAPEIPLDVPVSSAPPESAAPVAEPKEIGLPADLQGAAAPAPGLAGAEVEPAAPAFSFEDSRIEISFYLDNGFVEEARNALQGYERKFPGNAQVAELQQLVEKHVGAKAVLAREPVDVSPPPAEPVVAEAHARKEEQVPSCAEAPVAAAGPVVVEPPGPPPVQETVPIGASPAGTGAVEAGGDVLGGLVSELATSLGEIEATAHSAAKAEAEAAAGQAASPLSGLLEEFGAVAQQAGDEGDPETHYNLGVAFREMGLLDEAIGEFQKVVRGGQKGKPPANFLQACTLLAVCFMDKKMPAIAVKWYIRALEAPGLDDDAMLALQYDLGVAHEQAGDTRIALEKFTEVYSQNIDYRDVAEKIRLLQQKVS